jgi:hypothetical protein
LTGQPASIRLGFMIRGGFLSDAERQALTAMARDGLAEHRIARRANAIVLLDKGWILQVGGRDVVSSRTLPRSVLARISIFLRSCREARNARCR